MRGERGESMLVCGPVRGQDWIVGSQTRTSLAHTLGLAVDQDKMCDKVVPGVVSPNNMGSVGSHLEGEIVGNKRGRWSNSSFEKEI